MIASAMPRPVDACGDAESNKKTRLAHLLAPVLQVLDERLLGQLKLGVLDLHGLAESLGLFGRVGKGLAVLGSGGSDGESALQIQSTVKGAGSGGCRRRARM
jgi:hypothetical protein